MSHVAKLRDGTEVTIRPMSPSDLDASCAFFQRLSEEDRSYLRTDVTQRRLVERRIRDIQDGGIRRVVALSGDTIVADGALELAGHEWEEHVGEIRLIVAPELRRQGLGMLLARELYAMAGSANIEELVVRMMGPQDAARRIFERLGFRETAVLEGYLKDRHGRKQDLVLMRRGLADLWREFEELLAHTDWQRSR